MRSTRGFTLIELLVVIAIIGILASIVLASLGNARTRAQIAREFAELKQVQNALELYANAHGGTYPGVDDTWYDSNCASEYFGGNDTPDFNPLLAGYINLSSDEATGQCIWYSKAPDPLSDDYVSGSWKYIILLDSSSVAGFGSGQGCYVNPSDPNDYIYCVGMR